jgi:glycosyltransferase involved in cell wall biosynthesis
VTRSVSIIGTRGYPSYYGGFETAVRKLAPYLAERGWDVTVYGREGATRESDPERDERVHTVTTKGLETKSLSTLSYGLTASWHASRRRPDVALVMNVANGYFLPLLRARKIPTLVNVDGIEWFRAKWGRLAKFVFHTGAKWTARFGDELIYDAKEIARHWKEEFGRDGEFIPYGGEFRDQGDVVAPLTSRNYVLVVARFVPENTIGEFVEAARELSKRWDVVIVGSSGYGGEIEDQVRELAEQSESVKWLGHVSDDDKLYRLWSHAGAYFHGHSVGGTNPALVQAMAAGAPTVARDTAYTREVLDDAAVFVEPSAPAIVEAIDRVMSDKALQLDLALRAQERAREHYTWESVCARYEQALLKLIETR